MSGKKRGIWYWMSISQPEFMLPSLMGLFGEDAKDQANTAVDDLGPFSILLLSMLGVIALVALIVKLFS